MQGKGMVVHWAGGQSITGLTETDGQVHSCCFYWQFCTHSSKPFDWHVFVVCDESVPVYQPEDIHRNVKST